MAVLAETLFFQQLLPLAVGAEAVALKLPQAREYQVVLVAVVELEETQELREEQVIPHLHRRHKGAMAERVETGLPILTCNLAVAEGHLLLAELGALRLEVLAVLVRLQQSLVVL